MKLPDTTENTKRWDWPASDFLHLKRWCFLASDWTVALTTDFKLGPVQSKQRRDGSETIPIHFLGIFSCQGASKKWENRDCDSEEFRWQSKDMF